MGHGDRLLTQYWVGDPVPMTQNRRKVTHYYIIKRINSDYFSFFLVFSLLICTFAPKLSNNEDETYTEGCPWRGSCGGLGRV